MPHACAALVAPLFCSGPQRQSFDESKEIMKNRRPVFIATQGVPTCVGGSRFAQEKPEHRAHEPIAGHEPRLQIDQRDNHDHYSSERGYAMPVLPGGSIGIGYRGGSYFYHGGVWFKPVGGRFVVVAPPFGIVVPLLPPPYATVWIGGAPYDYANGAYYAHAPGQGYAGVAPPPGAQTAQPVPAAPAPKALPEPMLYPRNGQNAAQTEADRQECKRWAATQPSAMNDAQVFQRAVAACMDGRGYTAR